MAKSLVLITTTLIAVGLVGCSNSNDELARKMSAPASLQSRAERRAFTGAPPVIPHAQMSTACVTCHTPGGMVVPNFGFAPANPHTKTPGMSDKARCEQCHLFQTTKEMFVASTWSGLSALGPKGERAHFAAPPTIPHADFMRENCLACHAGPTARPEIRCQHAERDRCQQCHLSGNHSAEVQFPLVDVKGLSAKATTGETLQPN